MPAFEYSALDAHGKPRKGLIEGDTPRHARAQLREQGLMPLEIHEVSGRKAKGGLAVRRGVGMSSTELALFTRQLATLVRSGLPLDEALAAVSEQSERKDVQRVALGIRASVVEGNPLAAALNQFPSVFPPLFRATVEAGESSGQLDLILERLADYVERRQVLRQKIAGASFYPLILLAVAIAAVILLMTYVVPQVVGVFDSLDAELPSLTRGLIAVSDFLRDNGLFILLLIVAVPLGFAWLMRGLAFRRRVHGLVLRLPLIGRLTRAANTGRFMRTLGILFGSGVPILEAMRIGAQVVTNVPMREAINEATIKVREGASLSRSLQQSKLFPPISVHLVASGESAGKLDDMLERAADHQEREVETLMAGMVAVFGPTLILAVAALVMVIVLAILLPIFDLNQLVQ